MTCSFCGTRNSDGEHRCRRCGRRPGDTLTGGGFTLHATQGALATKVQPIAQVELAEPAEPPRPPNFTRAVQGSLFDKATTNVIPIAQYAPPRPKPKPAAAKSPAKPAARRASRVVEGQGSLDFLPPAAAKPRTLGTTVEAMIYCDAPVAATLHRAVAAALDLSLVLIAYGLFFAVYALFGGGFELNRLNLTMLGGMLLLIGFTYGLFWTVARTETPGMHWTHLKLTTFDGFPPDGKQRVLRFAGSCLSVCTVVGLLWSLADEENLTWQDHMSRTFPTPRELESQVFRRR
ncbi:MAG TPA: RDD family protein [Bryobacteraceae bacterium]|jgi:uncharacterized RDD family membrane protein YckC